MKYDEPKVVLILHKDSDTMALVSEFMDVLMDSTLILQVCCTTYQKLRLTIDISCLLISCSKTGQTCSVCVFLMRKSGRRNLGSP